MIKGIILACKGERARVKVDFANTDEKKLPAYLDAWNPINAHPGDKVEIEYREFDAKKGKLITNGFPVLGVLAGLAFGNGMAGFFKLEGAYYYATLAAFAVLWFLLAWNYVKTFKRDAIRKGVQPVVASVDPVEFEIDISDDK